MGICVGVILICLTDLPASISQKINNALFSTITVSIACVMCALCTNVPFLLPAYFTALAFVCGLFNIWGFRGTTLYLAIMIGATFTVGLHPKNALLFTLYIFCGAVWYHCISILQAYIFPFRSANRAFAKTVRLTQQLMQLRAKGYDPSFSLSGFNNANIKLNRKITAQHEVLRQLLLSDKKLFSSKNKKAVNLIIKGGILVDLYEQISAVHADYGHLRKLLANINLLDEISSLINLLHIGLQSGDVAHMQQQIQNSAIHILQAINDLEPEPKATVANICNNVKSLGLLIEKLHRPVGDKEMTTHSLLAYENLVVASPLSLKTLLAINRHSPVFRFALRLALLTCIGASFIAIFPAVHYSYWLLLTILLVSRPVYAVTVKRNKQRLMGTAIGLAIALMIIYGIDSTPTKLVMACICLYLFFTFLATKYLISSAAITIAIVLALSIVQGAVYEIFSLRTLFTLVGCLLCVMASYLFPTWNTPMLKTTLTNTLIANKNYLTVILAERNGLRTQHDLRLARKEAYQTLSTLSDLLDFAEKEPLAKKVDFNGIRRIQFFIYQLNALIASLSSGETAELLEQAQLALPLLTETAVIMEEKGLNAILNQRATNSQAHNLLGVAQKLRLAVA